MIDMHFHTAKNSERKLMTNFIPPLSIYFSSSIQLDDDF